MEVPGETVDLEEWRHRLSGHDAYAACSAAGSVARTGRASQARGCILASGVGLGESNHVRAADIPYVGLEHMRVGELELAHDNPKERRTAPAPFHEKDGAVGESRSDHNTGQSDS